LIFFTWQENSDWEDWRTKILAKRNVVENVNQWACGYVPQLRFLPPLYSAWSVVWCFYNGRSCAIIFVLFFSFLFMLYSQLRQNNLLDKEKIWFVWEQYLFYSAWSVLWCSYKWKSCIFIFFWFTFFDVIYLVASNIVR